jgi:hypothetical protein
MAGRLADAPAVPAEASGPISAAALASQRSRQVAGMSRRTLLRRSLGAGLGPLPIALGQPGVTAPKVFRGCGG